jgi:hypothetical protein
MVHCLNWAIQLVRKCSAFMESKISLLWVQKPVIEFYPDPLPFPIEVMPMNLFNSKAFCDISSATYLRTHHVMVKGITWHNSRFCIWLTSLYTVQHRLITYHYLFILTYLLMHVDCYFNLWAVSAITSVQQPFISLEVRSSDLYAFRTVFHPLIEHLLNTFTYFILKYGDCSKMKFNIQEKWWHFSSLFSCGEKWKCATLHYYGGGTMPSCTVLSVSHG